MRIAWTGPVGDGGGVPSMGRLLLEEMLRQGVEIDLFLVADASTQVNVAPAPGLRVLVRRSGWRWNRWYSRTKMTALLSGLAVRATGSVLLSARLLAEHRRRRYDAVYQLSQTELFLLGRLRRLAPPIIVHPCVHAAGELRWHRRESRYALASERRAVHYAARALLMLRTRVQPRELARADRVLGLSDRFNAHLHEDYGVPESKLAVVRTPVDLDRFTTSGPTTPAHRRTLLFISRISARKGVEEIVELSHRLADLSGSVRLLVIGGPTMWSDYRAHLDQLHPDVAEYVGGVASDELPKLMRSASMLIVPSRYEPGSIATVEALGCGLPVVVSREVGAAEVVSGPHVRFHEAMDVSGLEAGVRSLLDAMDHDEAGLRAAARANAEEFFAPEVVAAALIAEIAQVAGARPPRPRETVDAAPSRGSETPGFAAAGHG